MRQLPRELAVCVLLLVTGAARAAAQQGSLQITGAAQSLNGDARRLGGQPTFEPDFGVNWLQPGKRFGMFQIELRGTSRDAGLRLGKGYVALRDFKYRGLSWTLEGGDTYFSSGLADYRFSNLSTPSMTFAGAAISARSRRVNAGAVVGRTTAWRNIFGTDAETLDQDLAMGQVTVKATDRLEIRSRASRVRTSDLEEFGFRIAASDQAGGGARFIVTPAFHLVADGSIVSYRRRGEQVTERDGSVLVGASVLLARGWIQANISRFSPGDLPVLNQPLADRQMVFAAAEYDVFRRWRAFGGVETYRSNLDAGGWYQESAPPVSEGTRGFGGLRFQVGSQSSVAVRLEEGDRRSRYVATARSSVSDTGVAGAEWQGTFGRFNAFSRYARRENVESTSADASYTQHETSGQLLVSLSRTVQLFGNLGTTLNRTDAGGGSTYWQGGGGGQAQLLRRSLWLRGEATVSRNVDLLTHSLVPRESLNMGLNGEIARNTILGLNVYADHLNGTTAGSDSWIARSTLRVTRSFPTGSVRVAGNSSLMTVGRGAGTGSIVGTVYMDWNANGNPEPDEGPIGGIPIRLSVLGNANTSRDGAFTFLNVPVGLQAVGLDTSALPVDFDPPLVSQVQIELTRGETRQVAFGLIPLGAVHGRVIRDVNANGHADAGEPAIDGAVLVLDSGARSEQVRKGQFRFDAVRAGEHTVELLIDSLPEGAAIQGQPEARVSLGRDRLTSEVTYLVTVTPRAEVRRVFPPRATGAKATPPRTPDARSAPAAPPASATAPAPVGRGPETRPAPQRRASPDRFAIQVAALNDPRRARALVQALKAEGYPAYLVEPDARYPDGPYRVRVGRYDSRGDAQRIADKLEAARGEKLWVIRELRER